MKAAFLLKNLKLGGIENLIIQLANEMCINNEIFIISTDGIGEWDSKLKDSKIINKQYSIWDYKDISSYVQDLASYINNNDIDVVYLNDTILGNSILSYLNKKIKIIGVLHAINPIFADICIANNDYIDGFLAVSPRVKQILIKRNITDIYMVPNGIQETFFQINSKIRKQNTLRLLFCGRIYHNDKGVLFIPEILERLEKGFNGEIILNIVGNGPDEVKLIELIEEKKLKSKITFKGTLETKAIIEEMQNAHYLLAPSQVEAFGLSILEAQSQGCVPVVFEIEGVTDLLIEDNENGLVSKYLDIDNFADKIVESFIAYENWINLSNEAIKTSRKFTIKNTAIGWIDAANKINLKRKNLINRNCKSSMIDTLSFSKDSVIQEYKKKWLVESKCNIIKRFNLLEKNVVIFGTLYMAYFLYSELRKYGVNIVGFIDNNYLKKTINDLPIFSEENIYGKLDFDVIIVSIESKSRKNVKENLTTRFKGKEIIEWTELL